MESRGWLEANFGDWAKFQKIGTKCMKILDSEGLQRHHIGIALLALYPSAMLIDPARYE